MIPEAHLRTALLFPILAGCKGVLHEGESHARGWESVTRRTETTATWYFALSQEHVFLVNVKGKPTPWHCILPNGFNGAITKAPTGGYNKGRDDFANDLIVAGRVRDWTVDCTSVPRPAGSGLHVPGVAPVTWDDHATACTAMRVNPE